MLQVLLEKFKEKNPAVGKAANESLTIMHKYCFSLLDVAETLAGMGAVLLIYVFLCVNAYAHVCARTCVCVCQFVSGFIYVIAHLPCVLRVHPSPLRQTALSTLAPK